LDIQIREVATSSTRHQDFFSDFVTAVENDDLAATVSRGQGAEKTGGSSTQN
jgi:hypothetical protein